jgi:PKD repeat protein
LYSVPGTYIISLIINGGSSMMSDSIIVYRVPLSILSLNLDTICFGNSITLSSISVAGSAPINFYEWIFGDGIIDSTAGSIVSHIYQVPGNDSARLIVRDTNGCSSLSPPEFIHIDTILTAIPTYLWSANGMLRKF